MLKWLNKKPPVQADVQRSESLTAHEQYKWKLRQLEAVKKEKKKGKNSR